MALSRPWSDSGEERRLASAGMKPSEARDRLRAWVKERTAESITDDEPIFETGLLSSLDMVELILFVESLKGGEIDSNLLDPEVFTSIDTLMAGFFDSNG